MKDEKKPKMKIIVQVSDEKSGYQATLKELVDTLGPAGKQSVVQALGDYFTGDDPVSQLAMSTPLEVKKAAKGHLLYSDCVTLIKHARNENKPYKYDGWPPLET